jgi:5-oxoprolinase (ATP-hydrolysing) subunit A
MQSKNERLGFLKLYSMVNNNSPDINCDMGEEMGYDETIMPYITSANIACGYHAGDETTIKETILLSRKYDLNVGAHPSFLDKENFGRTEMQTSAADVYKLVKDQLTLFQKIAIDNDCIMHHVKPHGALYNMAARDAVLAKAVCQAIKDVDANLKLYGLSGSLIIKEAKAVGLTALNEVFADRTYGDDGSLTPRTSANALINDAEKAVAHVREMLSKKTITALSGKQIPVVADTICIHGDGKNAVAIARALYDTFIKYN